MSVKKGGLRGAIAASKKNISKSPGVRQVMGLDNILDRPHGDTRDLNWEHVQELAESIAAVGLIQPLAVDSQGHLLAGGHRRAALHHLRDSDPHSYAKKFPHNCVPVRVFEFSATEAPDQAIAIEAAENEKRRDYTPSEVRELADRLVEAGYRNKGGRPKKGEKALTPALMTIVGKSKRTVERYLATDNEKTPSDGGVSKFEKVARQLDKLATDPEAQAIARKLRNAARALRELEG